MATQITTISAGNILIETGHGIPTHIAPKGSQFTDIDTANLYFNKDGLTDWELNVDSTNSGATISINTFSTFSSTTIGQSSVVATNSSDLLSYSGINISILTNNTDKIITFSASTGGGGGVNTYTTGFTYDNNLLTIKQNQGQPDLSVLVNTMTGLTVNGNLNVNTISATTYQNLPIDIRVTGGTPNNSNRTYTFTNNTGGTFNVIGLNDIFVTGGTYNAGTATFTNNTGGTFNVTGFLSSDTYVTGFSYNNNVITLQQNQGQSDKLITINTMTGLTVNGGLTANTISGGTLYGNGSGLTNIPIAGITNLQSSLDNKFDKSGGTVTGNVLITGDVTILGTATTINTQTLTVKDNIITINSNYSGNTLPYPSTSGVEVLRGSATTATLLWDETSQKWVAGVTGSTRQILLSGDSLSLLSSGHTHPISEIINLQSSLDSKFDKTGGIVSGNTLFTNGITASTISATTYFNLPLDIRVTGGTYSSGTATFTNNTGGTFNVTGFTATDTYVTGFSYNNNTFTIKQNQGQSDLNLLVNTMTGLTINGDLTVSGGTQSWFSGNSSSDLVRITQVGSGNALVVEDSNNPDTTPFVINNIGRVGIGTTSPSNFIDVYSTSEAMIQLTTTGSSFALFGLTSDEGYVYINNNKYLNFYTNNIRRISISSGGTVGIGVNIPTEKLEVNGNTLIYGRLSATTISATTYLNLPVDIRVTGGTYSAGTVTMTNNTGGTFNITGFSTTAQFTGGTVTGATNFTGGLTANTISATTYFNLPLDIRVTGATYSNNTFTYTNNTGGTFNVLFNTLTGLTVNGNLTVTGNTSLQALTGTSALFSGSGANILTVIGSGSTTSPIFSVQGSTGATIFSISDSTSGPLFWVDTALDVPIMEVYDTSPNLIIYGGISASTITATTISATTYLNLPTEVFVTGSTYSNNTFTFRNNTGGTFNVLFNTVTGLTVNGNLTITGSTTSNSLSATTITGGTFYGNGSGLTNIPIAGVTNLQSSLDNKFDKSGGTVTGSVLITGDVTILGTATTINTQTLTIKDNIITINSNYTGNTVPYPGTSGIEVLRGSATTATLLWDETSQKWVAGISGNTKQILFSGDNLSLLSSGHTHPISEIINLQSSLDNKFDNSGGTITGNLTVTGNTISNSVSATTITGTTIYGNGSNLTGVVKGTGSINYVARFISASTIGNGIIQDNGTNTSINSPIYPNSKLTVVSSAGNFESTISAYNSNTGSTGVRGISFLPGTIGTIYGLIGEAFDAGTTNIGVYGYGHLVDWTAPNAIGGKFEADGATNNYSLQLIDGTEGLNKVLVSKTTDGKANWSDVLSGLTRVNATTISATTYQNLPATTDTYVTGFTYSNNTYTLSRNNGLSALTQTVNTMTGLTITGNLIVSGGTQSIFSGNSSSELVLITQTGTGDAFVVEDSANSDPSHFVINASGNTAIGLLQPTGNDKLTVSGNTTIYGVLSATTVYSNSIGVKTTTPSFDLEVNGTFGATSKSFVIKHPTQEGKKLVYGAIEGPEFGVYVRGKVDGNIIELPEEWIGLVDENSITVQLTGDGMLKLLYVKNIKDNKVYISNMIPFIKSTGYYTVYGERKDIDKIKKVI